MIAHGLHGVGGVGHEFQFWIDVPRKYAYKKENVKFSALSYSFFSSNLEEKIYARQKRGYFQYFMFKCYSSSK